MSDRRPIRILPPDVAAKIAAGEVVERPASAVKELIDNSLDAGSTDITVEARDAGLKLIRVTDNGCGIPAHDLHLAFDSHATSKVSTLEDLERLTTLGFRGEALPSIAAVSRLDMVTALEGEEVGSHIRLEYGEIVEQSPHASPPGTRVAVSDLFGNVPVRRKFVRSLRAEANQVRSIVVQYALARPDVRFSLTLDGVPVFHTPGSGDVRAVIAAAYGPEAARHMHDVEMAESGLALRGMVSAPGFTRQNRSAIHLHVNGRPVQNRNLAFVLEEAYSGRLMTGRHPLASVNLVLPPSDVDPNIHPAKSEVRFAREREVHGMLHRAVSDTLLQIRLAEIEIHSTAALDSSDAVTSTPSLLDEPPAAEPSPQPLVPDLPVLRVFGQTNAEFIVAEGPQGLYMIDQHAAHERVLFDRLDRQFEDGEVSAQPLLEPATIELDAAQLLAIEENRELLRRTGFVLEPFGSGACLIRAIPAIDRTPHPVELVGEVLTELASLPAPSAARERALAATACKMAVKAGQTLDLQEMRELVRQLERTARPATCPHGRPTMIHLSHVQLEREFGRR